MSGRTVDKGLGGCAADDAGGDCGLFSRKRSGAEPGERSTKVGGAVVACSFCARTYQRLIISLKRAVASDRGLRTDSKHAVRRACPTDCYSGPAVVTASFTECVDPPM